MTEYFVPVIFGNTKENPCMNRLLCAALLLSLVSTPNAHAQIVQDNSAAAAASLPAEAAAPPDEAQGKAARLLKSASARERAWGAYLSARHELGENVPALVELLERGVKAEAGEDSTDAETSYALRAVLDALIQLDAEVPAATLQTLYRHYPDEAVILLSNPSANNQATLLALLAETPAERVRWLALGNLLAQSGAQGFSALLLAGMEIDVRVRVFTTANEDYGWNGGGGDACGGSGNFCSTLEGFPPVAVYVLTRDASRGSVVVADGTHTVYYLRQSNVCPGEAHSLFLTGNPQRYRQEYLLSMLGISPTDSEFFDVEREFEIVWKDDKQFARDISRLRKQVAKSYEELLRQLQERNLLTPTEASTLKPNISFKIIDHRRDPDAPPLPEVPAADAADDPTDSNE